MKLHAHRDAALNTVTAYGTGWLEINARRYEHALLVQPEAPVEVWPPVRFEDLAPEHFEAIAARAPEVVLLGTGASQRFAHPRLVAALAARRIGVEAMDTGAACRTYNILMSEGRKVLAALLTP
ncbi:MAG: Mth938-like domain-containing protein [Burkholderiaceae bacterium]|jgi:uncharacterized protein|nr:Mth938-like domain-containing protein [Burkholderiales bacterium]MCZ8336615.1 Mth938-like domain-containing protein [Burkholderiaceae bacterium]